MEYFVLGLLAVCLIVLVVGLYLTATAADVTPELSYHDVETPQLYQLQILDWVGGEREYVQVFSGSLRACRREQVTLFAQGHNHHTCRIVQVV